MTDFWNDFPGIPEDLARVRERIRAATASTNPTIGDALNELFDGGGKMLRPGLLLVASRFGTADAKKTTALAAALEMLHVATLIHDDVIDDSPLRRGNPTAHTRVGRKDAVLIGDFLLSRCFLLAAEYTSPRNATLLAHAVSTICSMEIEQDTDRYTFNSSIRAYLRKIMGKTALLFSLACYVGAAESKARPDIAARLRRVGYDIGMAFQIIDDILDYSSTEGTMRKPVGNDLKAGLCTLPLLCALRHDDGGLADLLASPDRFREIEVDEAVRMVADRGGLVDARRHAVAYTERSLREIGRLPAGAARDALERIARTLLERHY